MEEMISNGTNVIRHRESTLCHYPHPSKGTTLYLSNVLHVIYFPYHNLIMGKVSLCPTFFLFDEAFSNLQCDVKCSIEHDVNHGFDCIR